MSLVDITSL